MWTWTFCSMEILKTTEREWKLNLKQAKNKNVQEYLDYEELAADKSPL